MTFEGSFDFFRGEGGFGEERRFEEESKKKKRSKNKGKRMPDNERLASFRDMQERDRIKRLKSKKSLTELEEKELASLEDIIRKRSNKREQQ